MTIIMITHKTTTPEQTITLAKKFAKSLRSGDIICFKADLGAGKTTFTKGLAEGLKISSKKVNSPTFVLLNIYEGKLPIYHFDLYRIESEDMFNIGYDEFVYGDGVAVIEWSERLDSLLPKEHFLIEIKHKGESQREIRIKGVGKTYKERVQ